MKITDITQAVRDPNRVNVSIDGKFRLSLDIAQVVDLNVKVGLELDDIELQKLEGESQYGKLYVRALEYTLSRPRSVKEMRDYLWRKTLTKKYRDKRTNDIKERAGVSEQVANRVFEKLQEKGHIDDRKFAFWWVESRNITKGSSIRQLKAELFKKGVDEKIINQAISESTRNDLDELQKVISKRAHRYGDQNKLIRYLLSKGYLYDDIKKALSDDV